MKEAGVDISNHTRDVIDPEILNRADYIVTLNAYCYVCERRSMNILYVGVLPTIREKHTLSRFLPKKVDSQYDKESTFINLFYAQSSLIVEQ